MPRRSKLRRRSSGWSDLHIEILRTGADYFDEFPEADRQQAWNELRKEIMQQWLTEHPGLRPFSWWLFDIPKGTRRQRLDGRHPHDDPRYSLSKQLFFGCPQCLRECDIGGIYESQEAYLRRHSLLSGAELRVLTKGI